jgi:putative membrane protein
MKVISKIIWGLLFLVVFVIALKNMDKEVVLAFFSGYEIKGPLPLVLLGFMMMGFVLGVLAMTPTFFRHRRDLAKHRKIIDSMHKENEAQALARTQPPVPDTIVSA